jgi:zinc transport system substrate-binding protein
MSKLLKICITLFLVSCNSGNYTGNKEIITVSIAPFGYFVEINVMVPASADPHIYEPVPGQIAALGKSRAYISNGYLGFEMTWLDRFYEANPSMRKLSLGSSIDLIEAHDHHEGEHTEGADPHYWLSPKSALAIAGSVRSLLTELNPAKKAEYDSAFMALADTIASIDSLAVSLFSGFSGKTFMIFHPSLGYIARDYGLNQIAVENEGKEPTPSSMMDLIDIAKEKNIKVIFIQKGFDTKNAEAVASDTGAEIVLIDPLSEDWPGSVRLIMHAIHRSFELSTK